MSTKLGNGGNGQENYDPNTGRYVGNNSTSSGNSSLLGRLQKGVFGKDMFDIYNQLDNAQQQNFLSDLQDTLDGLKQTAPDIPKLTQTEIDNFEQSNPNLHQGEVQKAANLIKEYEKIEPEVTDYLTDLVNVYDGMLVGLEHRMKTLPSVVARMEKNGGGKGADFDVDKALYGVKDILRYTACFEDKDFDQKVPQVAAEMQGKYDLVRILNRMTPGSLYKGVNCLFKDDNGHIFEMQFHTPESLKVKDGYDVDVAHRTITTDPNAKTSHDYYEQIRNVKTRAKNGQATQQEIIASKSLNKDLYDMWNKVPNHTKLRIPFVKKTKI